jgi:hypothetical protein
MDHIYGVMKDGKGVLAYAKTFHSQIKVRSIYNLFSPYATMLPNNFVPNIRVFFSCRARKKRIKINTETTYTKGTMCDVPMLREFKTMS